MIPSGLGEAGLREVLATLSFPFIEERSIKVSPGRVSADRLLLSFVGRSLDPDRKASLLSISRQLGLSRDDAGQLVDLVDHAETVHFGADNDRDVALKIYLEFPLGARPPGLLPPDTVFFAVKWVPGRRATFSIYRDLPDVRAASTIREVAQALTLSPVLRDFLDSVLAGAVSNAPDYGFPTMEVVDVGTPRRSIDVNLYGASVRVAAQQVALGRLAQGLAIPAASLAAALPAAGDPFLGHVSLGHGRDGEPFATIYFGAVPRPA